ncbi:MAG: OmpH family outer membrane protein [Syntrophobacteraceae bacterium]
MKKNVLVCLAVVPVFFLIFNATLWAASSPKIGYFDMQAVLSQSKSAKDAQEQLTSEKKRLEAGLDDKVKAFKTAREEFEKKKSVMDDAAKNKKTKELQEMGQEGEKLYMEAQSKLKKLENDLMGPVLEKVKEIVRRIGREDKYDFIFEKSLGGIVFAGDSNDLTKRISQDLEK